MFHMQRKRRLHEEEARFYSAEICLALNFLHDKGCLSVCLSVCLKQDFLHDKCLLFVCSFLCLCLSLSVSVSDRVSVCLNIFLTLVHCINFVQLLFITKN